jgi:hypothetical protein
MEITVLMNLGFALSLALSHRRGNKRFLAPFSPREKGWG